MPHRHAPFLRPLVALAAVGALAGHAPARADALLQPWSAVGAPAAPWHAVGLPQQTKPMTRFSVVDVDGRRAVRIEAESSYGNLVHTLPPQEGAMHLSWRWRVERPLEASDLREKRGDDTELRVCVFFDEPMDDVPFVERQLLRVAQSRSAEPLPTATLCYVWDTQLASGTVLPSPFTRRLRYVVLETGNGRLDQWIAERRDVGADFLRAFGDEAKQRVPPVTGIAVGADADNTRGHSIAYVSELSLDR